MVVWEALDALSRQLELCGVDAETRVIALLAPTVDADRAALVRASIARTGASALEVRTVGNAATEDEALLQSTLQHADLVIACGAVPPALPENVQLLEVLDVAPHDFPPHANLRRRVWALTQHVETSDRATVVDSNGTALELLLTGGAVHFDHGLVGDDCDRAVFPAGWVEIVPPAGSVDGTVVLMPGDANLNVKGFITSPVRLHIANDHIVSIEGESADADVLRALLEYPDEASAYGVAGLRVGLNRHDTTNGSGTVHPFDARLRDYHVSSILGGNLTLTFGDNLHADRPCSQQLALVLPRRSLALDGLPVTLSGGLQNDFAPDVYER